MKTITIPDRPTVWCPTSCDLIHEGSGVFYCTIGLDGATEGQPTDECKPGTYTLLPDTQVGVDKKTVMELRMYFEAHPYDFTATLLAKLPEVE